MAPCLHCTLDTTVDYLLVTHGMWSGIALVLVVKVWSCGACQAGLNRSLRSGPSERLATGGSSFSLSLWERAGVRVLGGSAMSAFDAMRAARHA